MAGVTLDIEVVLLPQGLEWPLECKPKHELCRHCGIGQAHHHLRPRKHGANPKAEPRSKTCLRKSQTRTLTESPSFTAPRYRKAMRQALAKHPGHHAGGLLDSAYDLHSNKYMDPADQTLIHHIKAMHALSHMARGSAIPSRPSMAGHSQPASRQTISMVHCPRTHGSNHHLYDGVELAGAHPPQMDKSRQ